MLLSISTSALYHERRIVAAMVFLLLLALAMAVIMAYIPAETSPEFYLETQLTP
ncbi:MAG: hypothetical protein IPI59_13050 [Sphingobacteriales bacterium]|jgi:hypothetical protein|nr:hypothetical protein [Sphingobacteriales bacterium]MBP9142345.1 hypothetical protein [Chitinophagales bacterium]MDA0198715.1 hypothetical protein [Bacteroidota bacterium]MBK6889048.1 hypothetical protein [Sphingobacteriales bacterium]MBK7528449.1 hypothetical protein [Sphingobacteriales bacterium]